jgi:TRAP-type C4-dicarboxylate transport system substrate-binding protein
MRSTYISIPAAFVCMLFAFTTVQAQLFKIGSQAPERSIWGKALKEIAKDVKLASDGKVKFKIYHGGVQGDEQMILKKMRVKQLHGAAFIGQGLAIVYPDSLALTLPAMFDSQEEFEYVLEKIRPDIAQGCRQKGYEILGYPQLGFAYAFSRDRIESIEDLKGAKPWLIKGDVMSSELFDVLNTTPVSASVADVLPALNSGLIRMVFSPPYGVIALQWHDKLSYRLDREIIPATGVLLVDRRRWDKIPGAMQEKIQTIIARHVKKLNKGVVASNLEAIAVMEKRGLESLPVSEAMEKAVQDASDEVGRRLSGDAFATEFLAKLRKYVAEYRAENSDGE